MPPADTRTASLRRLALLLLVVIAAAVATVRAAESAQPDVARPHAGVKRKLKLCMRCRQVVDVGKEGARFVARQADALAEQMRIGVAARRDAAQREAARAATADAVGDPAYGTDPNDAQRVADDAALEQCLRLPEPDKAACIDRVRGKRVTVADPADFGVTGRPPRTEQLREPNAARDRRGLDPDPRAEAAPYQGGPPPGEDELSVVRPPFTGDDAAPPAALLQLQAQTQTQARLRSSVADGGGGGDAGDAAVPLPPPAFFLGNLAPPPQKSASQLVQLADMQLCVNEASRQFVVSLFRGVVGGAGDVECVDVVRGAAADGADPARPSAAAVG